jgi:DNA mismatch endonuclease (patch repair protein)
MCDFLTKQQRSTRMSQIRSKENKDTELRLIAIFKRHGITGWRRHQPLLGKPDFVFRQARIVLFVDGCFWHCCPKHSHSPHSNRSFWKAKFSRNRRRDRLVTRRLRAKGWQVIRIWEHELVRRNQNRVLRRIQQAFLKSLTGFFAPEARHRSPKVSDQEGTSSAGKYVLLRSSTATLKRGFSLYLPANSPRNGQSSLRR